LLIEAILYITMLSSVMIPRDEINSSCTFYQQRIQTMVTLLFPTNHGLSARSTFNLRSSLSHPFRPWNGRNDFDSWQLNIFLHSIRS
jgi:hypothetical protein